MTIASRQYMFVDEWDVAAPVASVFAAISDARSYPEWWKPVYLEVDADDGEPEVGKESRQHFKGRLPYHLRTRSRITRLEPPFVIGAEVDGDLRGTGLWTLKETADGGTHVRFDWRVHADRRLLKLLTRCCGRRCAGTTPGRSRGPARASSRTRARLGRRRVRWLGFRRS